MSLTTMRRKFRRAIKPIQWMLVIVFVLGCFTLYGSYDMSRQGVGAESMAVARVNGEEIPRSTYERALRFNEQRLKMSDPNRIVTLDEEVQTRAAAFEMALSDVLRAQAAREQGVRVSESQVRAEQKSLVDRSLAGKLEGVPAADRRQYEDQERTKFPPDQVRTHLLGQKLEEKIRAETKPTEAELMKSFQEFKTRHILVKAETRSDAEAKRRAEEVLGKIKSKVAFEDLARKYSDDEGSKDKGGDLGWVGAKTGFVPEFKVALLKLSKGEVSPLVKTQFGYHIIKVDDTRSTLPKDINKPGKKTDYMKEYTDHLVRERSSELLGKARQAAKIEPIDPFVTGYLTESDMLEAQQKNNQPLANQKLAEAIAAYEQAALGRYGGAAIYGKLSELYQQAKQDDKAIDALQKALSTRTNAMLAWQLGELYMKKKKNTEAVAAFQKAAEGAYDMPWLRPQLAQRFETLKRPDLAAKEQTKWAKWQKDSQAGKGTPVTLPTGQQVVMEHEQKPLSKEEQAKLQKEAEAAAKAQSPAAK